MYPNIEIIYSRENSRREYKMKRFFLYLITISPTDHSINYSNNQVSRTMPSSIILFCLLILAMSTAQIEGSIRVVSCDKFCKVNRIKELNRCCRTNPAPGGMRHRFGECRELDAFCFTN